MNIFEALFQTHGKFVEERFPQITDDYKRPLRHLKKKVDEAIESGSEEDFSCIQLLLFSAFRLRFPSMNTYDLIRMCDDNLTKVRGREWGPVNEEGNHPIINHFEKTTK